MSTVLTLPALLQSLARWEAAIGPNQGQTALDFRVVYTYVAADGRRLEILREQLEEGRSDDWPLPGDYEIDVVDSVGASLLRSPWRGVHFDRDALREPRTTRNAYDATLTQLLEESRIALRNSRADLDRAERRAKEAREELESKIDALAQVARERNAAICERDRAVADAELERTKRNDAELAFAELERDVEGFRPHLEMIVDHGIARTLELVGLGDAKSDSSATPESDAASPPAGAEDPRARVSELMHAAIYNRGIARGLVEQGLLSWETLRALVWLDRGLDLGPTPEWGDDEGDSRVQ